MSTTTGGQMNTDPMNLDDAIERVTEIGQEITLGKVGKHPINAEAFVSILAAMQQAKAEIERLKSTILSFGNGNDFDWKVLEEIERLKADNDYLRRSHDGLLETCKGYQATITAQAAEIARQAAVIEAARKVAKYGRWVPAGADNYDYMSMVNGVVGTDWNELIDTLKGLK